jgi:futalosine hydrolase
MDAIRRHRARSVLLAGCAGSYDGSRAAVGMAIALGEVRCHGIGAGGQTPAQLGFAASDRLVLAGGQGLALSVAEASGSPAEAAARAAAHPGALVEEMEGYAVALAATSWDIPCSMVRGVSNLAGDRDRGTWQLDQALAAAKTLVDTMLAP